jgi:type II restriction/modification system DNA methylase subunit YeeA
MRAELLKAATLDWSKVSPAIFGSMFQGVLDEKTRRSLGAHYTSERNILKVIKPLFLNELYEEFDEIKHSKKKLNDFHEKLSQLKFLDPACGGGNFLVITYRELRKLEHLVLAALHGQQQMLTDVTQSIKVNVNQMYGIEIDEFPALIAETALWLTDHQMNTAASQQFGHHYVRLPLTEHAMIVNADALDLNWGEVVPSSEIDYILGNPPFIGSKYMTKEQRIQVVELFGKTNGSGVLDYVSAWYIKTVQYMKSSPGIQAALVSTSSIVQGEQVNALWRPLLDMGTKINFAHQNFKWSNEGKDNAAVYCVVIGFSLTGRRNKRIYTYEKPVSDADPIPARNINPYLVDAPNVIVQSRVRPSVKRQK